MNWESKKTLRARADELLEEKELLERRVTALQRDNIEMDEKLKKVQAIVNDGTLKILQQGGGGGGAANPGMIGYGGSGSGGAVRSSRG